MKKLLSFILALLSFTFCYANKYKINKVDYSIEASTKIALGITKPYCLEQKVPVNTNTVFESEEELLEYLEDYKQQLNNTRVFADLSVEYDILNIELPSEDDIYKVNLKVYLVDSLHLFFIPGPKYDSNDGLTIKIKIKDRNFLGTLNTLNSDINVLLPTFESDNKDRKYGMNFSFDYPFKAGIFDSTWVNDAGISYTSTDDMPEWNVKTGLVLSLPFDNYSLVMGVYQKFINNLDYKSYDDAVYFSEEFTFSVPISVYQSKRFGTFSYTPYVDTYFYWDFNKISKDNSSLASPVINFGHSFSIGRVDWQYNLRNGISLSLSNYYIYNFSRKLFYPIISLDTSFFKSFTLFDAPVFNRIGLNARLYSFIYMLNPEKHEYIKGDGISIGGRLRGIRDTQYFPGTDTSILSPTSAIVLNFDLPYHLFTTNFTTKFINYFNFDLQVSPFIDIALTYNKFTNDWYSLKDGFYTAGLEFLVYPCKWSSITVRANLGYDIGRKFLKDYLNMDWRDDSSLWEFYFGLSLHY